MRRTLLAGAHLDLCPQPCAVAGGFTRSLEDPTRHLDRLAAEEEWERSFGFTDPDAPPEDAEGGSAMAEYFYRFQDGAGI